MARKPLAPRVNLDRLMRLDAEQRAAAAAAGRPQMAIEALGKLEASGQIPPGSSGIPMYSPSGTPLRSTIPTLPATTGGVPATLPGNQLVPLNQSITPLNQSVVPAPRAIGPGRTFAWGDSGAGGGGGAGGGFGGGAGGSQLALEAENISARTAAARAQAAAAAAGSRGASTIAGEAGAAAARGGALVPYVEGAAAWNAFTPTAAEMGGATGLGARAAARLAAIRAGGWDLSKGALGKGAGSFMLGSMGANLINDYSPMGEESNWTRAAAGASYGAGVGGALGSVLPGLGTGLGAGIGAGVGAAGNVLWGMLRGDGEDKEANAERFSNTFSGLKSAAIRSGAPPEEVQALSDQFFASINLQSQMVDPNDKDAMQEIKDNALTELQNGLLQSTQAAIANRVTDQRMLEERERERREAEESALRWQEQSLQILAPYVQSMISGADATSDMLSKTAAGMGGPYAAILNQQAQQEKTWAANRAGMVMQSAAVEPWLAAARQQQAAINQQSQQMVAQAMANASRGMYGQPQARQSNGFDLNELNSIING